MEAKQNPIDIEEVANALIDAGCYAATADEELLADSSFLLLSVYHEEIVALEPEQQIKELRRLADIETVRLGSQELQCDVVFDPDPPAILGNTALYADEEHPGSDLLTEDPYANYGDILTTADAVVEKVRATLAHGSR